MADSKYKALLRELKAKIFAGGYDGRGASVPERIGDGA